MKSKNKFHGIMEKSNININSIDINDLSSLLIKSGFMEKFSFTEEQLDILNYSNIYYQILYEILEFNEIITVQEITKKYGKVISSINDKFNIKSNFKEIFKQYVYYTKANISLNIFLNWLIILDLIITNFKEIFDEYINDLLEKEINIFNIDSIYESDNNDNLNNNKLDFIYENIKRQPQFLNKDVESDLIIIIYLLSLGNKIIYNKEVTTPKNVFNILELYNKIYISNITISLLIFINIIMLINISIFSNRSNKIPFENFIIENKSSIKEKINNRRKSSMNNINEIKNKSEIPNFILFEDEIILSQDINEYSIKSILFQNCLKLYSLYHLNKNKVKFFINLSIQNIQELINKLNDKEKEEQIKKKEIEQKKTTLENQGPFAPNNNFEENLKNYIKINKLKSSRNTNNKIDYKNINIKENIMNKRTFFLSTNKEQNQNKNLNYIKIMTQNNLNICFNNFTIDELLIKFINLTNPIDIKKINTNYLSLITNCNSCYFRESVINLIPKEEANNNEAKFNDEMIDSSVLITPRTYRSKSNTQIFSDTININSPEENVIDNLSIKDFFIEIEILYYFLEFYSQLEYKKLPKIIQIKLNTFKCNINQITKTIQIFFNFSKIKEKILFEFLKEVKNMNVFIQKYQYIIRSLKEFKLYQSTIRISQTNFRSNQLNYIFNILTHKIVDFIEENSINKMTIYETKLNNYNPNMKIYLKDYSLKKKNLLMLLKLILFKSIFFNKIKFIIEYLGDLVDQWEIILLSDSDKDIKLLKSFDDNKLFIFFLKEKEFNANKNLISFINNKNNDKNEKNKDEKKSKNIALNRKKDVDNPKKQYEYLNIIMYIKNSKQDYINILNTMESFLSNKNLGLDFKTNLICDRIFFEESIMNDSSLQNMQIVLLNMIDDFFLVTKTLGSNNKEYINQNKSSNKITKAMLNEYYNYDFFIGDDFVGILNNHLYDFNLDFSKNFSKLIYDFLSVLSSCLEFIYFILKVKSIFILRFVYIIHTKNNCYYSLEVKNWNFFIKKMTDFSSLFTANIKTSKPLFCLLKIKKNINSNKNINETLEDNFYDVFMRLFLNLNRVFKSGELNKEFFKKLHKNIFKDYQYNLVAFSYEAFLIFNDFFISNDYLSISNGEKFENCYIIPSEGFFDKKNYKKIIKLIEPQEYEEDYKDLIVKNIVICNFGIDFNYMFKYKDNILFGFSKINYFIREYNNYVANKILYENKQKKEILKKKLEEKKMNVKNINKYLKLIEEFHLGNYYFEEENDKNSNINKKNIKIVVYNTNIEIYTSIIKDYNKEKIMIQTQKNELNVLQNQEKIISENKNIDDEIEGNNNKKDCIIY